MKTLVATPDPEPNKDGSVGVTVTFKSIAFVGNTVSSSSNGIFILSERKES